MRIGIANSLNLENRTGVEEYTYQILKHLPLIDDYKNHQFFLYNRKNLKWLFGFGWTQIRLSREMLKKKLDVLFIPGHSFPIIHPNLVITIHGLEFENVPKMYSWIERLKLRFFTKRNAKHAKKIIVPSQSVKNDLIKFYRINAEKVFVIHHGIEKNEKCKLKNENSQQCVLYLGGGHKRKNIKGLKTAYEILKNKYNVKHKLVLAGINKYISESEKQKLLKTADVFVYPSFYEGFGFPPLEAQSVGVPVVSSNISAMPEILDNSALLINPNNPEEIADAIYEILINKNLRNELIKKGQENVRRFSWPKCAQETLKIISN